MIIISVHFARYAMTRQMRYQNDKGWIDRADYAIDKATDIYDTMMKS